MSMRTKGSYSAAILARLGQLGGIVDGQGIAACGVHLVDDRGGGGDEFHLKLALQPFLNNLHVQQPQKTATETEAQSRGCFGLEGKGSVVELQFFQGDFQVFVIRGVGGVQAAEDHGLHFLEAGDGRFGRALGQSDGVAHAGVAQFLDVGAQKAHFARAQLGHVHRVGREHAQPDDLVIAFGGHKFDTIALAQHTVHNAEQHHHALVGIVPRVEDKGFERGLRVALGGGQAVDHGVDDLIHVETRFGRHAYRVRTVEADALFDFGLDSVGLGAGQIDFIEYGHYFMIVIQGQIDVGQSLGLHALGGVHHQQGPVARGQRARNLVVEVHVAGGVDEVEDVLPPVFVRVGDAHGLGLDGDAALALQVHLVQILIAGFAVADQARVFEDTIGQGGFAVVDVGDNAEIADVIQGSHSALRWWLSRSRAKPVCVPAGSAARWPG